MCVHLCQEGVSVPNELGVQFAKGKRQTNADLKWAVTVTLRVKAE